MPSMLASLRGLFWRNWPPCRARPVDRDAQGHSIYETDFDLKDSAEHGLSGARVDAIAERTNVSNTTARTWPSRR